MTRRSSHSGSCCGCGPASQRALYPIGWCHDGLGQYTEALEPFPQSLALDHSAAAVPSEAEEAGAAQVEVCGTGTPGREFPHVDDRVDACLFLMEHYADEQPINIGWGRDPRASPSSWKSCAAWSDSAAPFASIHGSPRWAAAQAARCLMHPVTRLAARRLVARSKDRPKNSLGPA
jgi:hypothetical protein